jgi:hypothetical protein
VLYPTWGYGQLCDLQFAKRIMVAHRSEMSAEWKVRFAICIASVAIQAGSFVPYMDRQKLFLKFEKSAYCFEILFN